MGIGCNCSQEPNENEVKFGSGPYAFKKIVNKN